MERHIFTRKKLREIVPDLTSEQEDKIIDLYITAAYQIKRREIKAEREQAQK